MPEIKCISTKVEETAYRIEYEVIQQEEQSKEHLVEYGICCRLFEAEKMISSEKVQRVTSKQCLITKIVQILAKNQVFPAHLREVIEDLLILEYEEVFGKNIFQEASLYNYAGTF